MSQQKKNLSVKGTGIKVANREFGELLESKLSEEEKEKGVKPSLYIRITATEEDLKKLQPGFTITMEDPKKKYQRQMDKLSEDAEAVENIKKRMDNIPAFVKRRLIMRVPVDGK